MAKHFSVIQDTLYPSLTVGAADIAAGVFVTTGASGVVICDATGDVETIGVSVGAADAGDSIGVRFITMPVNKALCSEPVAAGALVYVSATGMLTDIDPGSKLPIGRALTAGVTAGDEVSFVPRNFNNGPAE